MSIDGSLDSKPTIIGNNNGNGIAAVSPVSPLRLRVSPNSESEHKPDKYDDMETEMEEFSPLLFSSLERFLPNSMLSETRAVKAKYMREIMLKYFPRGEWTRDDDYHSSTVSDRGRWSAVSRDGHGRRPTLSKDKQWPTMNRDGDDQSRWCPPVIGGRRRQRSVADDGGRGRRWSAVHRGGRSTSDEGGRRVVGERRFPIEISYRVE
ncbi:hypothetical protein Droror1_Dr00011357 [Drosera rotundifolia]